MIISFEGPDGSGKSTQAEILYNTLEKRGLKVKLFHFPRYESPIGSLIGNVLQDEFINVDFTALQMLYASDQTDFAYELNKLLSEGYIVILDRYDLSTIAYYIAKTNCSIEDGIATVTNWQSNIKTPDITFIFDSKHSISDRREEETLDKFEKDEMIMNNINKVYLTLYEYFTTRNCKRFRESYILDASLSIDELSKIILELVIKKGE